MKHRKSRRHADRKRAEALTPKLRGGMLRIVAEAEADAQRAYSDFRIANRDHADELRQMRYRRNAVGIPPRLAQ